MCRNALIYYLLTLTVRYNANAGLNVLSILEGLVYAKALRNTIMNKYQMAATSMVIPITMYAIGPPVELSTTAGGEYCALEGTQEYDLQWNQ